MKDYKGAMSGSTYRDAHFGCHGVGRGLLTKFHFDFMIYVLN
jgi:hypothetical protein